MDTEAVFSYCEFTYDHQLVLWNNRNLATNTVFYVDIFNIQQPKASDTTPNTITVSIDTDGDYSGGINGTDDVTDTAAASNTINNIIIEETSMSSTFIRTPQDITIKFDTISNIITGGSNVYLLFPAEYGEWINRGSTLNTANSSCVLEADNNAGSNVLNACSFISKRVLKMTVNTGTSHNLHTISLKNIYSPSKLPEGKYNQYRFKLFMVDGTESNVNYFSFTDHSHHLTLEPDSNLIDLSWKYYSIMATDSLITLTDQSDQTFIIYMGYYSNVIELRQSIYPLNFKIELQLALTSHLST